MASASVPEVARADAPPAARRPLEPAEVAWLAVPPCAVVVVLAIVLLGPPLGHALFEPGAERFWPQALVVPEPVEHARYLLALLGALLPAAVVVTLGRGRARRFAGSDQVLRASRALAAVGLLLCLAAQHDAILHSGTPGPGNGVFNVRTVAVAALLALLIAIAGRSDRARGRIARWTRERPSLRVACTVAAVLVTGVAFSAAVSSDAVVGSTPGYNLVPWDMSETFAVLDGRTPLVDFHAQYAHLWPYAAAAIMAVLGSTVTVWTTVMATASALTLLAVHSILRRVTRSAAFALALYVPLLALGSVRMGVLAAENVFSLWPLRLSGPFVLAWLTTRHLDGLRPRRTWVLFAAAGLVLLNNVEFGSAAVLATWAALVCGRGLRWADAGRLLGVVLIGLVAAAGAVAALTLVRAGAFPDYPQLLEFSKIYGVGGWVLEPMPWIGLHIAVYLTFVAALAMAVVRAVRGSAGAAMTGMLAWSGSFGLVAGGYYAGRSDLINLASLFIPWGLALMLVVASVTADLNARGWRRLTLPQLVAFFGLGLAVCSLPQLPSPREQLARWREPTPTPIYKQLDALRFVARWTAPGERVTILIPLGDRIAYDLGLVDVAPYSSIEAMPTEQQMRTTVAAARREHARKLFLATDSTTREPYEALIRAGFAPAHGEGRFSELVDAASPGRSAP